MKSRNICKFVNTGESDSLVTTRFIYETEIPKEGRPNSSAVDTLYLVTGGSGTFTVSGVPRRVTTGDLVFAFAGQSCLMENGDSLTYMYIEYYGARSTSLYVKFGITPQHCLFRSMEGLIPIWKESLVRAGEENIDLLSESMLLYAFSKLEKNESGETSVIHSVTEYVEEHFSESSLTLAKAADALGYNAKYLSHLVKRELSVGFSEYLRDFRLRYAVLLMEQGVTSVKNVAILSGFTDPLYFSKVFKTVFGVSPKGYIAPDKADKTENPEKTENTEKTENPEKKEKPEKTEAAKHGAEGE